MDVLVLQIHEELDDRCVFEEFDDLPQIAMKIRAERILEHIVDVPVPQNLEKITVPARQIQEGFVEVKRPTPQDRTSMPHVEVAESSGEVGSAVLTTPLFFSWSVSHNRILIGAISLLQSATIVKVNTPINPLRLVDWRRGFPTFL